MGLLNETYAPELEFFGDICEIRTFQHISWLTNGETNIIPNYVVLNPVIGASPKAKHTRVEKQKVLKLVSAIVLASINTNGWELSEDTKSLIARVVQLLYPVDSVKFTICHHWNQLHWNVGCKVNGRYAELWGIRVNDPGKPYTIPPFKRNKGNKTTCMRKVERLRNLLETTQA